MDNQITDNTGPRKVLFGNVFLRFILFFTGLTFLILGIWAFFRVLSVVESRWEPFAFVFITLYGIPWIVSGLMLLMLAFSAKYILGRSRLWISLWFLTILILILLPIHLFI